MGFIDRMTGGGEMGGKQMALGGLMGLMGGGGLGIQNLLQGGPMGMLSPGTLSSVLGPIAGGLFANPMAPAAKAMGLPMPTNPLMMMLGK